jgi:hypothetical protein
MYLGSSVATELPTVNPAPTMPSAIMAGNPVVQILDDVSLKAAVEINRREVMDPEQVEMRFMEAPHIQSPALVSTSASTSPSIFVPFQISSANPSNIFASPILSVHEVPLPVVQTNPKITELEQTVRYLEDERQKLQRRLSDAEAERNRIQSQEQHGSIHLRSLQSSVMAMQQTMSQQASQLGGLQQQLGQQQREAQAWAQEVQDARTQLRRQQEEHAREINSIRGEP